MSVRCYRLTLRTEMDADSSEKAKTQMAQRLLYVLMAAFILLPLILFFARSR